jgi:hypothetical protein
MALVLKDRVKETTASTGTSTINLAGAATGFEGFVSAVGSGNSCYYTILDANGSAWEVGIGTVTDAATDTLSRDTILESSNSDNAISLTSGTHTVFLTYPADKSVYRNSNDQIVATASGIVFSDSTVQTTSAVTYTAGTGLSLSGTEFNVSGVDTSLLQGTISSAQIANDAIDSQHYTDGSIDTAHIGDDQVTYAKIQHVSATDRILGRDSAGAGEIEEITASGLRTMINVADGATANVGDITSVIAGTGLSGGGTSGDVTVNVSGVDTSLLQGTVANNQLANSSVTITAGTGLSNGGSVALGGSVSIDVNHASIDHDSLNNFVANEHVDHTSVTLTAGSGLSGGGDISSNRTFNALTATTSASGITTLTNTINGDQDKALTPKAVNDANYLTSESDTLQTVTGRGAVTTNDITVSGELVVSRPEAFAALKVASSGQQISFGNRGEDGNDGMVTIKLDDDGATYAASSGVQVSLNSAKSALAVVPTAGDTTIPRTVFNGGDSSIRPDGDAVVNIKSIHEDVPNLIVYGKSGGTSHLTEWKDSDGDTVAYIGEKGTLSLGKDFHIQKFDSYVATGVGPTDASGVALTFNNEALHNSYSYRIRCYDEDSNRQDGSVFLARKNDDDSGNWDVTTVAIQKNAQNEYPIVFNDGGTLKVKTGGATGGRDIVVYIEGIYVNRNDVTGYIWGGDFIWSKVSTAGGSLHSIYASGNVGINKEVPAHALEVTGTGNFAGIQTPSIEYTDGDDAITIADGGAVTFAKSINQAANTATDGGIVDIDCSLSNYHEILMNADATRINFTNVTAGQRVIVRFKQHSSHIDLNSSEGFNDVDVNGSNATIKWGGGVVPTLTETNNAIDVYGFIFESTVTNVMAFIIAQDVK